jgi:hypothetical protein
MIYFVLKIIAQFLKSGKARIAARKADWHARKIAMEWVTVMIQLVIFFS